jgi:D-glycero-D-manno-heptose 1,7-bisphosphate phosphatase
MDGSAIGRRGGVRRLLPLPSGCVQRLHLDPGHYERKPNPGLILRASAELDLDLQASLLIGDKGTDIEAAHRTGISGYLFSGGNLADFVSRILKI